MNAELPEMLTVAQVADALQLSPYTVRQMVRDGRLPGEKLGYRTVRIPRSAIESKTNQTISRTLIVKESTATQLYDFARTMEQTPNALGDSLLADALQDLQETVAAIQKSVDAVQRGDVIDLEDFIAERRKKRESRPAILTSTL